MVALVRLPFLSSECQWNLIADPESSQVPTRVQVVGNWSRAVQYFFGSFSVFDEAGFLLYKEVALGKIIAWFCAARNSAAQ